MNIKDARKKAGLTQKAINDLIGIPIRTLQDWESGRRKCPEWCEKLIIEKIQQISNNKEI